MFFKGLFSSETSDKKTKNLSSVSLTRSLSSSEVSREALADFELVDGTALVLAFVSPHCSFGNPPIFN